MATTAPDHSRSESDADDDAWALELEEELLADSHNVNQVPSATVTRPKPSLANDLPQEVLITIVGFTPVGRLSKAWSLASSTFARRNFTSRLTDALLAFSTDAAMIAQEVEGALFAAYRQRFALPKAYAQKARQLLFNLKDVRNEGLRARLFTGELTTAELVRMSARAMANPQLVHQRQQWIKKRTYEVMRDARTLEGYTQTEQFECRVCGSHRTCYRQWRRKAIVDRTRVLVRCRDCPYQWEL